MSGAYYLITSTLFLTVMGICIKNAPGVPFPEVVFFRSLVTLVFSFSILKLKGLSFFGVDRKMLVVRGITGTIALLLYFMTLQKLPFAVAVTLQYLSPIFTILISALLLKEPPTRLQWFAVTVAFFGVSLIYNVKLSDFTLYASLGVLASVFSAISYITIRSLNKTEHPLVVVFYFGLVGILIVSPLLASPLSALAWRTPNAHEFMLMLLMGLAAQGAQYCITVAYQKSKAPMIANFTYLNVVWAVLVGEFLWAEHLTPKNVIGISIIIVCAILASLRTLSLSGKVATKLTKISDVD